MQTKHTSVEDLAYRLWEARGRPDGSAEQDWLEAERELAAQKTPTQAVDESLLATFPASDPPASRLPDNPPANAEAKWEAAGVARKDSTRTPGTTRRGTTRSSGKTGNGAVNRNPPTR